MASRTEIMKKLLAQRDKFKAEMENLQSQLDAARNRLEGAESMLRAYTGEPEPTKPPRSNIKQLLLELLEARGADGLNATIAVDIAAAKNERLERNTASSLLSRFKADGLVTYDGKVYRLKQFVSAATSDEAAAMH